MELIGYYLLFAVSISISACYFWFWPALRDAKKLDINNSFTQYPILSTVVYIIISAVVAPLLLFPMFSGAMAIRFDIGLRSEIMKTDPEIRS
jgi:hypothetical protein